MDEIMNGFQLKSFISKLKSSMVLWLKYFKIDFYVYFLN